MSTDRPNLRAELSRLYDNACAAGDGRTANVLQACFFLLTGRRDESVVQLWDLSGLERPEQGEPHA